MKKFLALLLAMAMTFSLCACTADNPGSNTNSPDPTAGASATVPPTDNTQEPSVGLPDAEPTDEPTDQPTDEPTGEPTQAPESDPPATNPPATNPPATNPPATNPPATNPPATNPPATNPPATNPPATDPPATDPPATDPPASDPPASNPPGFPGGVVIPGFGGGGFGGGTTNPTPDDETPVAPTGRTGSDKDLDAFYQSLLDGGDDALLKGMDSSPLPDSYMTTHAYGWISTPCVQRTAYMSMASTLPNVIALIQVNSASEVAAVKAVLNKWIETESNDPFGYNPLHWQQNALVVSEGNYVMMIVSGNCDAIVDAFYAFI